MTPLACASPRPRLAGALPLRLLAASLMAPVCYWQLMNLAAAARPVACPYYAHAGPQALKFTVLCGDLPFTRRVTGGITPAIEIEVHD